MPTIPLSEIEKGMVLQKFIPLPEEDPRPDEASLLVVADAERVRDGLRFEAQIRGVKTLASYQIPSLAGVRLMPEREYEEFLARNELR